MKELHWCNTHRREATVVNPLNNRRRCEDRGGIMIPCDVVNLTGIAEIVTWYAVDERSPAKPGLYLCRFRDGSELPWSYGGTVGSYGWFNNLVTHWSGEPIATDPREIFFKTGATIAAAQLGCTLDDRDRASLWARYLLRNPLP